MPPLTVVTWSDAQAVGGECCHVVADEAADS